MYFDRSGCELKKELQQLGIAKGDILYVASDIKTLLLKLMLEQNVRSKDDRNQALNELIDVLQETVTESGTLLFPVFSWEWCRGNGFDYKETKGEVGTLSNWVLQNRKDFVRTKHPMYSFMVWGKDAKYLKEMDNQDAWSHASPFFYLQENHAKQLLFNIEAYQGMTFCHYLEQEVKVPYRHTKYFFGEYTDENRRTETRMYSMYVRDLDVESGCAIHNDWLIQQGVARQCSWEDNKLTLIDLTPCYSVIFNDMKKNNGKNTLAFRTGGLHWEDKQTVPYEVKGIKLV